MTEALQRVVRVSTGPDGASHFSNFDIRLQAEGSSPPVSPPFGAHGAVFRATHETLAGVDPPFHTSPATFLVFTLSGSADVYCGDGTNRHFGPGDVLLADDREGQGHKTFERSAVRHCLIVPVSDETARGWAT
jgi:hypothetical protein